jgi:hypothetical protein
MWEFAIYTGLNKMRKLVRGQSEKTFLEAAKSLGRIKGDMISSLFYYMFR